MGKQQSPPPATLWKCGPRAPFPLLFEEVKNPHFITKSSSSWTLAQICQSPGLARQAPGLPVAKTCWFTATASGGDKGPFHVCFRDRGWRDPTRRNRQVWSRGNLLLTPPGAQGKAGGEGANYKLRVSDLCPAEKQCVRAPGDINIPVPAPPRMKVPAIPWNANSSDESLLKEQRRGENAGKVALQGGSGSLRPPAGYRSRAGGPEGRSDRKPAVWEAGQRLRRAV